MNRKELFAYASTQDANPAVREMIRCITEVQIKIHTAAKNMQASINGILINEYDGEYGSFTDVENVSAAAFEYERCIEARRVLFRTLALYLQRTGHQIDF